MYYEPLIVTFSLLQDIVISAVFVISLLSGGAASAAYASDNDDFYNEYRTQQFCTSAFADQYDFIEDACNDIQRVRDSEGASAVSYGILLAQNMSTKYSYQINFRKRIARH